MHVVFAVMQRVICGEDGYLQFGQLPLSSAPLLRGKVAGLNCLSQVELRALMSFVKGFQLALQI